jgi:hypothetical protein
MRCGGNGAGSNIFALENFKRCVTPGDNGTALDFRAARNEASSTHLRDLHVHNWRSRERYCTAPENYCRREEFGLAVTIGVLFISRFREATTTPRQMMMELKMSVSDSQASATSACELPKMPATVLAAVRKTFTANPMKVGRKLRWSRLNRKHQVSSVKFCVSNSKFENYE